jgi:hypothetical protein
MAHRGAAGINDRVDRASPDHRFSKPLHDLPRHPRLVRNGVYHIARNMKQKSLGFARKEGDRRRSDNAQIANLSPLGHF